MRHGARLRHDGGRARHRSPLPSARWASPIRHRRRRWRRRFTAAAPRHGSGPAPASRVRRSSARSRWSSEAWRGTDRHAKDGFDLLRRLGGRELAAIVGAIMAARMAHVPVLLDGYACSAAAACLAAIDAQRARSLPRRALLGRAGASPAAREARQEAAASISACASAKASGATLAIAHRQSGARLPHRHGDFRRGRRQRKGIAVKRFVLARYLLATCFLFAATISASTQEKITATTLFQSTVTAAEQPIVFPASNTEVTALMVDIPAGVDTGWHKHPWPRYAYVVSGIITVESDAGQRKTYQAPAISSSSRSTSSITARPRSRRGSSSSTRMLPERAIRSTARGV